MRSAGTTGTTTDAVIHFLSFSVKQAFEGLWRNRVMSLAATVTMVLMLVLLSSLVIVLAGMQAGLSFIESKVEIRVELATGVPQDRVDLLQAQLLALPEVSGVTYISKEQALEDFRAQLTAEGREDLTEYAGYNPFPAQVSVKLKDPRQSSQVLSRRPQVFLRLSCRRRREVIQLCLSAIVSIRHRSQSRARRSSRLPHTSPRLACGVRC